MKIVERIRHWHRGTLLPPRYNGPNSAVVFFQLDRYQQPALARVLDVIGRFWLAHWKWIVATAIAVAAVRPKLHPWGTQRRTVSALRDLARYRNRDRALSGRHVCRAKGF